MLLQIIIQAPDNVRKNSNATLNLVVEKQSLSGITVGFDELYTMEGGWMKGEVFERGIAIRNYTTQSDRTIKFQRAVTKEDISKQNLILMPGFRLNWYYSGVEAIPEPKYLNIQNDVTTKSFVRNGFHKKYLKILSTLG